MDPITYGQKLVGLTFNPSGDPKVAKIKQLYADIIDELHTLREQTTDAEKKRHYSIAITEAQTAQMWAVKAITF
jgi:hypothetical protein